MCFIPIGKQSVKWQIAQITSLYESDVFIMRKRFTKSTRNIRATRAIKSRRSIHASADYDSKYERVKAVLDDMSDEDKVYIWNEYCRNINDDISEIYPMDDFDDMAEGMSPSDIARSIFYGGGFNPNDKFVGYTGYGNFVSFSYLDDDNARFYIDDLVDYIVDNDESFGDDDIREALDGDDEEDYE